MAIFKEHKPGTLSYLELVSGDPNGSRDFYTQLFDWQVRNEDLGEHGIYTQFLKDDEIVGALYELQKEQKEAGTPPHWGLYLTVMDADAAGKKAVELGGQLIMGPMDVFEHGRMCIIADPVGAVFCVWQPKSHVGVGRKDEANTLCWGEIMTTDVGKAQTFYKEFFGWTTSEMPMGDAGNYFMLGHTPDNPSVGMIEITPEMGPIPPHWMAYVQVDDLSVTNKKAAGLGGKIVVPPTDIPGGSKFCVIQDPQDAYLGLYEGSDEACD